MPDSRLPDSSGLAEYETLLLDVSPLLEHGRQAAGRAVNAVMSATYWHIGRRIVEQEQKGSDRASYGEELVANLAQGPDGALWPRILPNERVSDAAVLSCLSRENPDAV